MSNQWQLAQINVGKLVAPEGDPRVAPFFAGLDRINALAEQSEGFVWRLIGAGNSATDIRPTVDHLLLVNMSVWADVDSLFAYVYRSDHAGFLAGRREWFERLEGAFMALWWVPAGHRPSIDEGLARLWHLDRFGATAHAFTFKTRFAPPPPPPSS